MTADKLKPMPEFWEYDRVDYDDGQIVYEVHDPRMMGKIDDRLSKGQDMPDTTFIVFEGADARNLAAKFCAMMNRAQLK